MIDRLAADMIVRLGKPMRLRTAATLLFLVSALPSPALAIDPPYEPQMERLAEILGSLYFLNPLCSETAIDWRAEMADLVTLDQPDEDRQQRLFGAFNGGYQAFSRLYRTCTPSAEQALTRLLVEAEATAREIHTRFAE
jgi:uncharacterized protein (TIGR02301 family)